MMTWAAGFPAAQILLQTWDPLILTVTRFAMASLVLIPIWLIVDGPKAFLAARWGWGTLVGGLGFGAGAYLFLLGQSMSDPVTVIIVASAMPVFAAALEVVLDGRRLRLTFIAGVLIAVVGGIIAAGADIAEGSGGAGAALAAVATMFFAWGSRAAVRDFPELSTLGQTTITLAGGAIFLGIIFMAGFWLGLAETLHVRVDLEQMIYLVFFALGAMAISQLLWIMGVGRLGVALASIHMNTTPFYVMLIMIGLGGTWIWSQAIGALVVGSGVLIAQMRPRRGKAFQ